MCLTRNKQVASVPVKINRRTKLEQITALTNNFIKDCIKANPYMKDYLVVVSSRNDYYNDIIHCINSWGNNYKTIEPSRLDVYELVLNLINIYRREDIIDIFKYDFDRILKIA